jgi:hypothetical protein
VRVVERWAHAERGNGLGVHLLLDWFDATSLVVDLAFGTRGGDPICCAGVRVTFRPRTAAWLQRRGIGG